VFYTPCIEGIFDTPVDAVHTLSAAGKPRSTTKGMATPAQALATAPIPPQNLDAEESVLGAMMLSPLAIGAVTESVNLSAADFYRESHGRVYKAILSLYAKGEPVDAITVVDELDRTSNLEPAGGAERVHELAALVPAAANAAHYARIVSEMATLRGLIRAGNDIARLGFDRPGETVELVDRAEAIVFDLSQQRVSTEFAHIDELLKDSFETITKLYEAGSDITGTASGLPRSLRWIREVSGADQAAIAPTTVRARQRPPMISGTLLDPGGATIANTVGRNATMVRPMFCERANPVTRVRVGNSSWKKLAKVAFQAW